MRLTPFRIAKMNLIEGYHNKSIYYSIFFPVIFILVAMQLKVSITSTLVGLAFVFGSLDDALLSLSRERDSGTLAKLFLSPASRWSITGGRILSSILLGVLKATLVLPLLIFKIQDMEVYMILNPFNLTSFYIISSLTVSLTVLVGLTFSALCRDSRLIVLLASSAILLLAVPIVMPFSQSNPNEDKFMIKDYNPFWICYESFGRLVDITSLQSLEHESYWFSLLFALNMALYLIANAGMRRKIA